MSKPQHEAEEYSDEETERRIASRARRSFEMPFIAYSPPHRTRLPQLTLMTEGSAVSAFDLTSARPTPLTNKSAAAPACQEPEPVACWA